MNKVLTTVFITLMLLVINDLTMQSLCAQQYTEYEVKAGYLYNFCKFVSWPDTTFANNTSPIVVGIYGLDRFGEIIRRTIRNNTIGDRPIVIKYYNTPTQIKQCHILYIGETQKSELIDLLRAVRNKAILTVGDNIEGFCHLGGIINFTPQYSRTRFEINNNTAQKNNIIISSKLLSLAKIIIVNEIEF